MTMNIKIQGGTAREDEPALCFSCRHAKVVQGPSSRDRIVECRELAAPVTFKVTSCTQFLNRRHPSLWHMEDIAWVLRTDPKRRRVGFVRGRDLKVTERLTIDND